MIAFLGISEGDYWTAAHDVKQNGGSPRNTSRLDWTNSLAVVVLVLFSCEDAGNRLAPRGTVTLDGSPTADGKITDGTFAHDPTRGPLPGTFRVDITSSRKRGRKVMDQFLKRGVDEYL